MKNRIASMLLVLLTIGFFIFHYWNKKNDVPLFVETIPAESISPDLIVANEFLILMDEGDEKKLPDVMNEFDLELISPLGEWVLVARRSATKDEVVSLSSRVAQENVELLTRIEASDAVHSVQLNYVQTANASVGCAKNDLASNGASDDLIVPRDPLFPYQWHLSKENGVNLPAAWALTTGNENTVIALVDRNFDFSEQDLALDRCASRKYYYENILDYFPKIAPYAKAEKVNHGSQVMSVIAPCTDNALGLAGVDWHAQVFAVDSKDNASYSARMFGILWAAGIDVCTKSIIGCPPNSHFQKNVHPANVINASFGFAGEFLLDPPYGPVLDVIGRVNRQGRIIVASAGNEGSLADQRLPGAAGGVISVGASNKKHQAAYFSNFGRTIDVMAPGEEIMGLKNGRPISLNGTSFASPIVAGIASLMLSANPLLSWKHIEYMLKASVTPMSCDSYCPDTMKHANRQFCRNYCCEGDQNLCAGGIVDAGRAVQMAKNGFPNVALIDVDDYFIALSDDSDLTARLIIKNFGKKTGVVRMRKTDRHLKMWPELIRVAPISHDGFPGLSEASVFYDALPDRNLVLSLILEIANVDTPNVFHDRIEAIVEMVPDPKKPKILQELLPKK